MFYTSIQGLGEVVKGVWEKDVSDWNQFVKSQEIMV